MTYLQQVFTPEFTRMLVISGAVLFGAVILNWIERR